MNTTASEDVLILAIESSCDETAASVVKNGRTVLSNVISSQIATHTVYGGVVPEIASREHIKAINYVIERALTEANVTLEDITAIGVTYGPGLVGALLVGVAEAKAIAYAAHKPLIGELRRCGAHTVVLPDGTILQQAVVEIAEGRVVNYYEWN